MSDGYTPSSRVLFTLAWRNLWRNHRRTLIMLVAIVIGVWAMILFSALMGGMLDEMVRGGLRALPGEAQIHHPRYRDDPSARLGMNGPIDPAVRRRWAARAARRRTRQRGCLR